MPNFSKSGSYDHLEQAIKLLEQRLTEHQEYSANRANDMIKAIEYHNDQLIDIESRLSDIIDSIKTERS